MMATHQTHEFVIVSLLLLMMFPVPSRLTVGAELLAHS